MPSSAHRPVLPMCHRGTINACQSAPTQPRAVSDVSDWLIAAEAPK